MTPLLLTLVLVAPNAMIRVPPKAEAIAKCPALLEDARDRAVAANSKVERAVEAGEIISIHSLERIEARGIPTLPPVRRAFMAAVDCVVDRVATSPTANRVDGLLALQAANIALAYRRPNEAISRLEFVVEHWPNSAVGNEARRIIVHAFLTDERSQANDVATRD